MIEDVASKYNPDWDLILNQPEVTCSDYKLLTLIKDLYARVNELESKPEVTTDASEEVQGSIQWVADECVGYLLQCACGGKEALTVSIYEDSPAYCTTCGRAYVLKQSNEVVELEIEGQDEY